jgi:type I restriction enzyme S subunit
MSWQTESLGNLLAPAGNIRAGKEDFPVLSITMHGGLVDQSAKFKKRVASQDISNYRVVYMNELAVGFPIDEGVLGFQTKYPAAVVSPAYGIWKLRRPAETCISFIEGYLRSNEARQIYAKKMRGAVARRRSINKEDFLEIEIPFPPLDEQKRIAAVLDKADALRRQRQESLQLTEKLLQSVFIDMFGNPPQQPQSKLADLLNKPLRNGLSPASGGTHTGTVFTLSAITRGFFNSNARKEAMFAAPPKPSARVDEADFLICRGNGNLNLCGQGQFPTDDAIGIIFPDTIIAASIDLTRISKAYFATLWNQPFVRKQLEGGARTANGIYKVNQTTLQNIQIPVPEFERQIEFERIAQLITAVRPDLEASAKYSDAFFSSIQQRAFRGELELHRLKLEVDLETPPAPVVTQISTVDGHVYRRPGSFIASPEVEMEMFALEEKFELAPAEPRPWSENYFKYRTLSQAIQPPFSFSEIWEVVQSDMEEASYETVKGKIFEYVEAGILEQKFDETRKEIVFYPRS